MSGHRAAIEDAGETFKRFSQLLRLRLVQLPAAPNNKLKMIPHNSLDFCFFQTIGKPQLLPNVGSSAPMILSLALCVAHWILSVCIERWTLEPISRH